MNVGKLDRKIQILKHNGGKNPLGERIKDGFDPGVTYPASYSPVSDGERFRSGQVEAVSVARFVVRWSATSAAITGEDRLRFEGEDWEVSGIKEIGRRRWIEITAWRK
ncbi:MAG: head-tail adaptor protein [Rhodobacteraceae bacterium]|nr:head-tail adaptor protein [Paracoccaceae bacterium]